MRSILLKRNFYIFLILSFLIHSTIGSGLVKGLSGASEHSKLFPEIKGWKISGEIKVYTPETLYDYINGAAELYLSYGFQELQVAEYLNKKNASIIVEIYRHKTPVYAFGIYSQERPTVGDFLNIGAQAYIEVPVLNFLVGNTYVKINSYSVGGKASEVLQTFANKVVENIDGEESFPKTLTCFPDEGKRQNSERFYAKNFLGYGFLHSAFTADYIIKNSTFRLFIIQGKDLKDCEEILRQYFQFAGDSQRDLKEDNYLLSDPYHGKVSLSWKGKYIWGVMNLDEENLRINYMILMEELLLKQNNVLSN